MNGISCDRPEIRTLNVSLADPPELPIERFRAATELAGREAGVEAFLISWKDNRTGDSSPNIEACGGCDMEGWEQYAINRGADLRVEVDGGDYIFMYVTAGAAGV